MFRKVSQLFPLLITWYVFNLPMVILGKFINSAYSELPVHPGYSTILM